MSFFHELISFFDINYFPILIFDFEITDFVPSFIYRDADLMFLSLLEFEKKSKDSDIDPSKGQQRFFNSLITKCPAEATNLMKYYYSSVNDVKSIMGLNLRAQKHIEAGSFMAKYGLMQSTERDRLTMLKVCVLYQNISFFVAYVWKFTVSDFH